MTTADTTYKGDRKFYQTYTSMVRNCCVELPCPLCKNRLLPSNFKTHFQNEHKFSQYRCIWCARHEYSWSPCKKFQLTRHMQECFSQLLDSVSKGISSTDHHDAGPSGNNAKWTRTYKLRQVQKRIRSLSNHPYPCPRNGCLERVEPRDMETHFKTVHAPFDPAMACVWCDGAFVWPLRHKNRNVEHLSQCFESYSKKVMLEGQTRNDELPPQREQQMDASPTDNYYLRISCGCPSLKGNMLRRSMILPNYAYEPLFLEIDFTVFPKRNVSNPIEFEDVVEQPRCYLDLYCEWNKVEEEGDDGAYDSDDDDDDEEEEENSNVATWYHVMISAFALDRFVRTVREFGEDKLFTLPYWCWCDGGPFNQEIFYQHRHMILVVRNGFHFKEQCWNKFCSRVASECARDAADDDDVRLVHKREEEDDWNDAMSNRRPSPPKGFCAGRSKKIQSWLHLAVTMQDLSVCQTHCRYDFKGQCVKWRDGVKRWEPLNNHFCFGENWHCLGILCLASVASRNGLKGLLDREERVSQRLWERRLSFSRWPENRGPWHVRVGDLKDSVHEVLPVKKEWRPIKIIISPGDRQQEAMPFLYLMERKKLLFERDPSLESLPEGEWLRLQAGMEGGGLYGAEPEVKNLFYDVVADARWQVSPFLQKALDFGEKYALEKIENAVDDKSKEWELERQKERDEDARQWKAKEEVWAAKVEELQQEIKSLRVLLERPGEEENGEEYSQRSEDTADDDRNDDDGGDDSLQKSFACLGQVNVHCNVSHVYYQTHR